MSEPERLRQSPKYRAWKRIAERNGATVRGAELMLDIPRQDGSILFAMVKADAVDPEGRPLHKYLLLRGSAVVVVTVVENRDTGERKFLMLWQRRIGNGGDSLEFPAGMLDGDVDDPVGVAVRELEEETGLVVDRGKPWSPWPTAPCIPPPAWTTSPSTTSPAMSPSRTPSSRPWKAGSAGRRRKANSSASGSWDHAEALKEVDSLQVRLGFHL